MKEKFLNLGIINNDILNLTAKEAYSNCNENKALLVDVREEDMTGYKQFNVPECLIYPLSEILRSEKHLSKDRLLIFADTSGIHSKEAVIFLKEKGFTSIANMSGGLIEWERSNLPLHIDHTNRLSGSCMCQLKFRDKKN